MEKHCGEKEKLLITSNFSFFISVFERIVMQARKNQGLFGKGLKEIQESMDRCTGHCDITEILLKTVLNTIQQQPHPRNWTV